MTNGVPDLFYNELLVKLLKKFINLKIIKNYEEAAVALKITRPSIDNHISFKYRVSANKYTIYIERLLAYLNDKLKEYQVIGDRIIDMRIQLELEKQKYLPNHQQNQQ